MAQTFEDSMDYTAAPPNGIKDFAGYLVYAAALEALDDDSYNSLVKALRAKQSGNTVALEKALEELKIEDPSQLASQVVLDPHRHARFSLTWYFQNLLLRDLRYQDKHEPAHGVLLNYLKMATATQPQADQDFTHTLRQRMALVKAELDSNRPDSLATFADQELSSLHLNPSQREAIAKALHLPISFVQGPPGTGKTQTIVGLIAAEVARGHKVAVVASNNAAVHNIRHKLVSYLKNEPDTALGHAGLKTLNFLVSAGKRTVDYVPPQGLSYRKGIKFWFEDSNFAGGSPALDGHTFGKISWESKVKQHEVINKGAYQVLLSSTNSLRKHFADGDSPDATYDLVIVDETSQMDFLKGLVALSSGQRIVLFGDSKQLPPVVSDRLDVLYALEEVAGIHAWFRNSNFSLQSQDNNFFNSCINTFTAMAQGLPLSTMLNEHYRCHPAIFGFCAEHVYKSMGHIDIRTEVDGLSTAQVAMPIGIHYYEGNYAETFRLPDKESSGRSPFTRVNFRQLKVFREHLLDDLTERCINDQKSVCLITAYRGQRFLLEKKFRKFLKLGKNAAMSLDLKDKEDERLAFTSTVNKAQGLEFDIVVYFPVEDSGEASWPASENMVNVALSRAVEEFHVVTSSGNFLPSRQVECVGRAIASEPADGNYLGALAEYVAQGIDDGNADARFGFRRSSIRSIFDSAPLARVLNARGEGYTTTYPDGFDGYFQREHACVEAVRYVLSTNPKYAGLKVGVDYPLSALSYNGGPVKVTHEVANFVDSLTSHFDLVVADSSGRLLLAIEVDGDSHNTRAFKNADQLKDQFVQACGGQVVESTSAGDHAAELFAPAFTLLRLRTNGESEAEIQALRGHGRDVTAHLCIEQLLDEALAAGDRANGMFVNPKLLTLGKYQRYLGLYSPQALTGGAQLTPTASRPTPTVGLDNLHLAEYLTAATVCMDAKKDTSNSSWQSLSAGTAQYSMCWYYNYLFTRDLQQYADVHHNPLTAFINSVRTGTTMDTSRVKLLASPTKQERLEKLATHIARTPALDRIAIVGDNNELTQLLELLSNKGLNVGAVVHAADRLMEPYSSSDDVFMPGAQGLFGEDSAPEFASAPVINVSGASLNGKKGWCSRFSFAEVTSARPLTLSNPNGLYKLFADGDDPAMQFDLVLCLSANSLHPLKGIPLLARGKKVWLMDDGESAPPNVVDKLHPLTVLPELTPLYAQVLGTGLDFMEDSSFFQMIHRAAGEPTPGFLV